MTDPTGPSPTPPERATLFARLASLGSLAQASVVGLYAWGVTVMPVAWGRGAGLLPKICACVGLVALVVGGALEPRAQAARYGTVWGLALSSALVWLVAPPQPVDSVRGVVGMLGWALFAFASAAPALAARGVHSTTTARLDPDRGARLSPRAPLHRWDTAYVLGGAVAALALQGFGWGAAPPERALLVRLVTIAAGIALVGASASVATARFAHGHGGPTSTRHPSSRRRSLRRAAPWLIVLLLLLAAGLVRAVRG